MRPRGWLAARYAPSSVPYPARRDRAAVAVSTTRTNANATGDIMRCSGQAAPADGSSPAALIPQLELKAMRLATCAVRR